MSSNECLYVDSTVAKADAPGAPGRREARERDPSLIGGTTAEHGKPIPAFDLRPGRRLIERGVRLVELIDNGSHDNWDSHRDMPDDYGASIITQPCQVHDDHATILHLLGLDHERLTYRYRGLDFRLTDVAGNVLREILA